MNSIEKLLTARNIRPNFMLDYLIHLLNLQVTCVEYKLIEYLKSAELFHIFRAKLIEKFLFSTCKDKKVNLEFNKIVYLSCVQDNISWNNHHSSNSHIPFLN